MLLKKKKEKEKSNVVLYEWQIVKRELQIVSKFTNKLLGNLPH